MNNEAYRTIFLGYLLRGIAMLLAIPLHESAHALVSARLGDTTAKDMGRLTLNPLAHFDLLGAICMMAVGIGWAKPVPVHPERFKNPKIGMAISAAAGPISNLLAAYLCMVVYKLLFYLTPSTALWQFAQTFLMYLLLINIALAVFNLLPFPPFDGSRVAMVFLPQKFYFRIMKYERYIFLAVFVLLMLGVFNTPLSFLREAAWDFLLRATGFVEKLLGIGAVN